jgi:hypothetical protein
MNMPGTAILHKLKTTDAIRNGPEERAIDHAAEKTRFDPILAHMRNRHVTPFRQQ